MKNLVIRIPRSNVFRFGDSNAAVPVFRGLDWTVKEGENWAVIGSTPSLLKVLSGHFRISPSPPPPAGLFPFLTLANPPQDPYSSVSSVSFANRKYASTGDFYDYTARYGALRDEDCTTLRQSMFLIPPNTTRLPSTRACDHALLERLADKLDLTSLLDLPLVALSNGQTRRSRILKTLLDKPELLLLDEPLTGLDASHRPSLLALLRALHDARNPRVIMSLRPQDPIPDWITHLAVLRGDQVTTGPKHGILAVHPVNKVKSKDEGVNSCAVVPEGCQGKVLAEMENVNVQYQDRKVLTNITWKIQEGDRWHLQGANGSGKTTLLSILTGDHPQSYTQTSLTLFSHPRPRLPTVRLCTLIGTVSPELAAAFPRRTQMNVWDVIGTGFDGTFIAQGPNRVGIGIGMSAVLPEEVERWRMARVWDTLRRLGPAAWKQGGASRNVSSDKVPSDIERSLSFANCKFAELGPGERAIVLFARAVVSRPPLLLLDEPWSGMDAGMVQAAQTYLLEGESDGDVSRDDGRQGWTGQAIVIVSHWESEIPWTAGEGLKVFRLEGGAGQVVS